MSNFSGKPTPHIRFMNADPYNLERFVKAQSGCIEQAAEELQQGQKRSHWMWFIFPQLQGLGSSAMANRYGIGSRQEAQAYLTHRILGLRLRYCTSLVLHIKDRTAQQIFGNPDDLKFRSCMTLFASVDSEGSPFCKALEKYFKGEPDPLTIERLKRPK